MSGMSGHWLVTGERPFPDLGPNAANALVPVMSPVSPASSVVTRDPLRPTLSTIPGHTVAQSSTPQATAGPTLPQPGLTHGPSLSSSPTTNAVAFTPSSAVAILSAPSLTPNLITSNTPIQPQSSTTIPSTFSVYSQDLSTSLPQISSAPSSSPPTPNANIAPTVRFILIGLLAGIPALTILGFIITLRWRRANRSRGYKDPKGFSDNNILGPEAFKQRKSARFSTFFGVIHDNRSQEKIGRKERRHLYATSIHSTAGIAGVGAHRGGKDNGVPPMIQYVKFPEHSQRAQADSKANFDNPFGTPPPAFSGFVIAPSRVSPHIPQTPPHHLVELPSNISKGPSVQKHRENWTDTPMSQLPLNSSNNPPQHVPSAEWTQVPSSRMYGEKTLAGRSPVLQPTQLLQRKLVQNPRAPGQVHFGAIPPVAGRDFLSPHPPTKARRSRTRQPPLLDLRHTGPTRASVAPSVYGGIASPRMAGVTTPNMTPVLPYLVPSPVPEPTPVLPYLAPPSPDHRLRTRVQEQRQTIAPVIVIEEASTIDSMSEYDDEGPSEYDEESRMSSYSTMEQRESRAADDEQNPAKRDGLVGSPHGYVPPSTTFSTASAYSLSSIYGVPSSISSSSTIRYESSASSGPIMSASSSDDSSVTVKAVPRNIRQSPGAEMSGTRTRVGSLWLPNSFHELERGNRPK